MYYKHGVEEVEMMSDMIIEYHETHVVAASLCFHDFVSFLLMLFCFMQWIVCKDRLKGPQNSC